jgi:orotidine-5'-phosphate decarboxylase
LTPNAAISPDSAFAGDALTASPFLGLGSLTPLFRTADRAGAGLFVVVRSSNPEGGAVQRTTTGDGRLLAVALADEITGENRAHLVDGLGPIGAVLGATLGGEAGSLADRLPNSLLLVPGIGAQGATLADVRRDFTSHYPRAIPSVSRAVAGAGPDPGALREAVERLIAEVRGAA